jgi:hypothetical protein
VKLSVVSLQANGETLPKLGHHDFIPNHSPTHYLFITISFDIGKNTTNEELKSRERKPSKLVQG